MKPYIVLFISLLFLFINGCISGNDKDNIRLLDAQVLCVYWSSNYENRDTLPAINFTLEIIDEKIPAFTFFLETELNEYVLVLPLKKSVFVTKKERNLQGLVLESGELYPYFEDNEYSDNSPCYTIYLKKIVNKGRLFFVDEYGKQQIIKKHRLFEIIEGLK